MALSLLPPRFQRIRKAQPGRLIAHTPAELTAAAMAAQGMGSESSFGPGQPLSPFASNGSEPRGWDFQSAYNVVSRPNRDTRVSFAALKGLIDSYDVARMAIGHRIDDVRSLNWFLEPMTGVTTDVSGALDYGRAALKKPDARYPFRAWLAMYLEDVLRYDAGTLYRRRDRAGRVIGLEVVSGTTIAPLLDFYGRRPMGDAPAFMQFVQGVPWQGMTNDDLIYVPFRPQPDSPYGFAPLEAVLLTANTDIRYQMHFLSWFTEGTIPEGFGIMPESISQPDQLQEMQDYWDALVYGDDAAKSQIKWVAGGTKFEWPKAKDFDPNFALFLMRKVCAAYHVTPNDLGFTEDVNRATGETQVDVQFRIGTLPLVQHVEAILTDYLQDDLGLPVEFRFDTGQEKEDRFNEAQAWGIYIDKGMASADEGRQELLGLPIDVEHPTPRFYNARQGPVPLQDIRGASGPVDPETYGPATNQPPSITPINPVEVPGEGKITKEITAGVTSDTGLAGVDLIDHEDHDTIVDKIADGAIDLERVAKAEVAAFNRFRAKRRRAGAWRDFTFTALPARDAHQLNQAGRGTVRKALGQIVAAGVAVVAQDTGRVLMLQRALDPADPAAGMWEMPGGCLEDGETPLAAACREWQEETGCLLPLEALVAASFADGSRTWTSANGVYQGFVVTVPDETCVPSGARQVINPDDPDGDIVEALAWWDPSLLEGNPAVRAELGADVAIVLAAINGQVEPVAKVGDPSPKASWRDGAPKAPQHAYDLRLVDHYTPTVVKALRSLWTAAALHAAVVAASQVVTKDAASQKAAAAAAARDALHDAAVKDLENLIRDMIADGYLTGLHAGAEQAGGYVSSALGELAASIDWSAWQPGDVDAAITMADGGLADLLEQAGITVKGISDSTLDQLGNAIADGLLNGDSVDTVAGSLEGLLGDEFRAERIAQTEMARAMSTATIDTYAANGIATFDLLLSDGACEECESLAESNPWPVSEGGLVPVHPLCRCAESPNASSVNGASDGELETEDVE